MRLIDADTLKRSFEKEFNLDNLFGIGMGYISIMQEINESPTIDAVQVVRCFECKAFTLKAEKPRYTCYKVNGLNDPKPNDYCSYGERREDGVDR